MRCAIDVTYIGEKRIANRVSLEKTSKEATSKT
jgi:hypothetical protein